MQWFEQLPYLVGQICLLFAVIATKAIVTRLSEVEPLQAFAFFCQQLAKKVNKPAQNSPNQQVISGFVAILITICPIVIILWLFADFILIPELWQAMLLFFALGGFGVKRQSLKMAQAIKGQNTYQAKQDAQRLLLRKTDNLSSLGLTKANIEAQILHFLQQQFVVALLFLSFGALSALSYRLLLVMHQQWNIKQPDFNDFGQPIHRLINLITWLPSRLLGIMMLLTSIGQNFLLKWRLARGHFFKLNNDFVIHLFALNLGVCLGGVAMYQDTKLRRVSFNESAKPSEISDVINASKQVLTLQLFSMVIIGFICALAIVS
ncbi:cobalamin biosynthesis protein [Thalassotalea sp. LPB0316]|uniref:cobalamin biosynthesis protein CobD/CbiB n=1 Tax=Thalassotalea sp. LPB0316 TaxID=2769490 RepID=UPI00186758F7|nr:cobalamin biosynthesis protein [Thalassotalea sp. LPB0316]QOL26059.1 cobalamin biosynthesis protein [Thalassotalea sp. LPB0316]